MKLAHIAAASLAACMMIAAAPSSAAPLPPVRHVFVIVLENEGVATTFGQNSPSPYLSLALPKQGAILLQYFGTGHLSNDNYLSMISGQAPNHDTQYDCQTYSNFTGNQVGEYDQLLGSGCVFPPSVKTVADQLDDAHLTWKGYMEDMGNDPQRETATCGRPQLGQPDHTQRAEAPNDRVPNGDAYASRHDPFVYFHSIVDDAAACDAKVVTLAHLGADLQSIDTTPNLTYIVPNLCNDGHDAPCADGKPGGLISADLFLKHWVPLIQASPAFKKDGLLVITFDESEIVSRTDPDEPTTRGASGDSSACCNERAPNVEHAGILGPGGGYIGAVALSPFIKPGTVSSIPYNHYSLLRTIETIFGLSPLGYAGQPEIAPFGTDVFTAR
ncbi:MAG TPA: alkaline phosphatase family protein [Candidatus Tumulicola sp.]